MTLRADNEVYTITDYDADDLIISTTFMKPFQQTKGHKHDNVEYYLFTQGLGIISIDETAQPVFEGSFIKVESNQFHKVYNMSENELRFVCVWFKKQ